MSRRLVTSSAAAAGGGGGSGICGNLCVESICSDSFLNCTTGCQLAQWELIDSCDAFTMTTSAVFDYTVDGFSVKYDLICFYIGHPVANTCTNTCLHLRFNGTNLVGVTGCNSTCAYYTTCDACANVCRSCTHTMEGYNCSGSCFFNTYSGVLYPHYGPAGSSNATNQFLSVGYDFRKSGATYWRGEGVNRGYVCCGCHSAGWETLSGMFICQNCTSSGNPGRYRFYGRKCIAIE